jgi:uroporphyrinogen decarboxylase
MKSRERVRTALAHKEPDRVPIDLGGSLVTGINAVAYHHLRKFLGIDGQPVKVANIILQLAEVEEPVRKRFGVDVIELPPLEPIPGVKNTRWKPWTLPDGSPALISADFEPERTPNGDLLIKTSDGRIAHWMPAGTYHFLPKEPPIKEPTLEELERFEPARLSEEELEFLHHTARRLYHETDYAIFGWFGGSLVEGGQFARGWAEFLMDLKLNPEFASKLIAKLAEAAMADLKRYIEAVGEYVDVIGFGDDLGIQTGLQFSPELYRKFFFEHHRKLYGLVHAHTKAYVFLHSCGSVYDLIPDLIEAGVDILNPVQTAAAKMEPERLKKEFGDKLSFWGGGSCPQTVLPWATPEEVEEDVRRRLRIFAPGGGYVFAPIHNIQPDVPPRNIVAMYDAALKWGRYPIS